MSPNGLLDHLQRSAGGPTGQTVTASNVGNLGTSWDRWAERKEESSQCMVSGSDAMRYCRKCVLPDTRPGLTIGDDNICNACEAHATKESIDWARREQLFAEVAREARTSASGYDCVIPVSGGKDSTWQVVKCLEHGLTPLAVTWKTPGRTRIGQRNLDNLIQLGVDHIDYKVNSETEKKFMRAAFERFGATAIPMHMAIFNIPVSLAVRSRIPLIVWGENSAFEYGGTEEQRTGFSLDDAWLEKYGVTHGTTARDWVSVELTEKDLAAYSGPSMKEAAAAGVRAVFLGYYFKWDPNATAAVAEANGFERDKEGARTGYYDHADIDDEFISVHHWMKWYKFGFTRAFDNLALEIRNGRLGREAAIEIIRQYGEQRPDADIRRLTDFLGWTIDGFFDRAEKFRNLEIWQRENGFWSIPDFLVPEWSWS